MNLVIVESPTKARTLSKFLDDTYQVEASVGHLRDLPKSKLGVDVEHDFTPVYVVPEGKETVVGKLQSAAKKAKEIYLAMDPDREGEAIAYHVGVLLSEDKARKFKRVTFHEITKEAILAAIATPGNLNEDLVDAQQARRVVDRLVGYSLSPVLWKKVRRGLSAGRVQSVAVRLIVDREREIEAFKAVEYWEIGVLLKARAGDFTVQLISIDDKQARSGEFLVTDKGVSERAVSELRGATYTAVKISKTEKKRSPYPPFTTSTLQQAAANVLGWTAKNTMRVAQQLYEQGKITYHRTDSFNLAEPAIAGARSYIEQHYGSSYLPSQPKRYKTKSKNAQEAHEAIRPTAADLTTLSVDGELDAAHQKLYRLIWQRFMASQMTEAIYDATTIEVEGVVVQGDRKYGLRATGSVRKFDGWRVLYERKTEDVELPVVVEGESLQFKDLTSEQKFTQPPPRFNDASLVKALEKRGIGRPSTYAPIISTIIARGYVERIDRRFYPTSVGTTVTDFLLAHFPIVMDYDFTAEMEEDLDRIARSEKKWVPVVKAFWEPFDKTVKVVEKQAERVKIPVEKTGQKCPTCGEGDEVIRTGRFGKFLSCSRFPECKYTKNYKEKVEGLVCEKCGQGDVVVKRTKKGRQFFGCSRYPECDFASWTKPKNPDENSEKSLPEK